MGEVLVNYPGPGLRRGGAGNGAACFEDPLLTVSSTAGPESTGRRLDISHTGVDAMRCRGTQGFTAVNICKSTVRTSTPPNH